MKSLAVSDQKKILDLEEFFNRINVQNNRLIQIKKSIIKLLNELVKNQIIENKFEMIFKSGKKVQGLIKNLSTSHITGRIKYIKFTEIVKKL